MESDITLTKVRLKDALERVELIHQAMTVDLPRVVEVSSLCFWCCPSLFGLSIVVSACQLLVSQDLEMMSIRRSRFLWEEHSRMEQEALASWWVNELRH